MSHAVINTIVCVLLVCALAMFLFRKLFPDHFDKQLEKKAKQIREAQTKKDDELLGKRMFVPRDGKNDVKVILYVPHDVRREGKLPAVFLAHGGSFMEGSADQMDTFCSRCADQWESVIVSIDYTTMDVQQFPYPQEEIVDTVMYFAVHSSEYNIDPHRFAMTGFTAGAYLLVGAAALLKEKRFTVRGLISFYPIVDDAMINLCDIGAHISPFTLVTTGADTMKDRYPVYIQHLKNSGTDLNVKTYDDAVQNFMEYNNPEYKNNPQYARSDAIGEEQAELARACEIWMGSEFERFYDDGDK